jgi:hypothetical protein
VVRRWPFLLALRFFGLTIETAPSYRKYIFKIIHDIVFHGNGGFDYNTVYNMPIWLRKFTFNEIQEHFNHQKKQYENSKKSSSSKTLVGDDGKVNTPEFLKASKQYKKKSHYK